MNEIKGSDSVKCKNCGEMIALGMSTFDSRKAYFHVNMGWSWCEVLNKYNPNQAEPSDE